MIATFKMIILIIDQFLNNLIYSSAYKTDHERKMLF